MTQFQGSSKVENIVSNILDNGIISPSRYVAEFALPKSLINEYPKMPNLMIRCSSVTIPGRNVSTVGYRIYGPARQMPYEILYGGEISITYILSRDLGERAFFEKWMNSVVSNENYKLGFYDDYIGNLAIHVLDKSDQLAYTSLVEEVFPKTVGDLVLANDKENDYMTQEITLGFRKYTSQYLIRQFPEFNGGETPKPSIPKNNGNGLGIGSIFGGIRQGAQGIFGGITNVFSARA
jgi:hypothetical protein